MAHRSSSAANGARLAMRAEMLARLRSDPIDWRYKGFPPSTGTTPANIGEKGWNLLKGDLFLPALVLKQAALTHNLALMAEWCAERGVSLAPHGKTTLSPELFERQFDAGAWGMTAATPSQMITYRAFGIQRIVLANELVEPGSVRWLANELDSDDAFEAFCLADSVASVELMEAALVELEPRRRIPVLVELGVADGRTGARTLETALAVAERVLASRVLEFGGVECYEGVLEEAAPIDAFLSRLRTLVGSLAKRGRLGNRAELIISAGGSEAFDRVVRLLDIGFADVPTRVVLRSGCYLTHDDGVYEERSPLGGRRSGDNVHFHAALEAWGVILSRPEPELALAGMGKRDVPFDEGLPIPLRVHDGTGLRSVKGTMQVSALNDQHAYIRVPAEDPLAVGDLIGCGISHPCTAFDKWRLIPIVDEDYSLIDAVHTFF